MRLLLCTDMDRTIIPNGPQKEAAGARETFGRFCHQPEVCLVYVTGRHLALMQQAIGEYHLPQSGYAITDVGTRIYQHKEHVWHPITAWEDEIDQDWQIDGVTLKAEQIYGLLNTMPGLSMQEPEKQNAHKISFYADLQKWNEQACLKEVEARLAPLGICTNLIWSVDETTDTGLLDILPPKANKRHAIEFLRRYLNYDNSEVVFAGDSGNDLEVLTSPIQSVLVANATLAVKTQAQQLVQQLATEAQFYQAVNQCNYEGNYSAGVLQGVVHYLPQFKAFFNEESA